MLAGHSYVDLAYHLGVNLAHAVVKGGRVVARDGIPLGLLREPAEQPDA
jgi:imidazolonepropionase-like amidohydrolase